MNQPARREEIERQIAEYERHLREQLLREHQLAELGAAARRSEGDAIPAHGGQWDPPTQAA